MYIYLNYGQEPNVSYMALIILKNVIKLKWPNIRDDIKVYIRQGILNGLANTLAPLRDFAGTVITTILAMEGLNVWSNLVETLITALKEESFVLGVFSCLDKICEDHPYDLMCLSTFPLIIDLLVQNLKSPSEDIRYYAIHSLNQLIPYSPTYLFQNMSPFLEAIFLLAEHDTSDKIQNQICHSFKAMINSDVQEIIPYMPPIIEYILIKTKSTNSEIALTASDFWRYVSDYRVAVEVLQSRLEDIITVLFDGLAITEEEYMNIEYEDQKEDALISTKSKGKKEKWSLKEMEDGDDFNDWTKRKACASGIDSFANLFPDDLIRIILPKVEERLNSSDWIQIESALLALGAISNGCKVKMYPYLNAIMPYLFHLVENPNNTLLHSTNCWVLRRYCRWIITDKEGNSLYYKRFVDCMLNIVSTATKQSLLDASLTALAVFIDMSGYDIYPYITQILTTIMARYPTFTVKNLIMANDCIGTLSECIEEEIGRDEYLQIYMPTLMAMWDQASNDDPKLHYIMNLFSILTMILCDRLENYLATFLSRSTMVVQEYIQMKEKYLMNPEHVDLPDDDGYVSALDLINGVLVGMTDKAAVWIENSPLLLYFRTILEHDQVESSNALRCLFGLIGDIVRLKIDLVMPILPNIVLKIVQHIQIRYRYPGLTSNATWCIGEILVRQGEVLEPHVELLLHNLLVILDDRSEYINKAVRQNVAITLGTLGFFHAKKVAPYIDRFYRQLCIELSKLEDDRYKENAVIGLYQIIKVNPNPLSNDLESFLRVITSWLRPKNRLRDTFNLILKEIVELFGTNWNNAFNNISQDIKSYLETLYNI